MIAVVGGSGLLGGYLLRSLRGRAIQAVGTSRAGGGGMEPLEVLSDESVRHFAQQLRPRAVLLTAAIANVDQAESDPTASREVNVEGTRRLLAALRPLAIPVVFFSTDYLFDGTAGPYSEEALPAPVNEYGRHKAEAEQLVLADPRNLVVRVTHLFGVEAARKNFAIRCVDSWRQGKAIRSPDDQFSTPTHAGVVADAAVDLLLADATGVFHVAGRTWCSRTDFARELARTFGFSESLVVGCSTEELHQRAARPMKAGLRCDRAERRLGRAFPELPEQVERFRAELAHE